MRVVMHRRILVGFSALLLFGFPAQAPSYAVLTHETIIDTLWLDSIRPVLLKRFPEVAEDQLLEAHAYAYGGCIIQDLGYYPFGSHLFSDLVHYVRSAEGVRPLPESICGKQSVISRGTGKPGLNWLSHC